MQSGAITVREVSIRSSEFGVKWETRAFWLSEISQIKGSGLLADSFPQTPRFQPHFRQVGESRLTAGGTIIDV